MYYDCWNRRVATMLVQSLYAWRGQSHNVYSLLGPTVTAKYSTGLLVRAAHSICVARPTRSGSLELKQGTMLDVGL